MTDLETNLRAKIEEQQAQIFSLRLDTLKKDLTDLRSDHEAFKDDHEPRMRGVEKSAQRFETLAWLAFGGGALSAFKLISDLILRQ